MSNDSSYAQGLIQRRAWYISHELLVFERADRKPNEDDNLEVWENLILIRAESPEEAYQKALKHGQMNEGPLRIDDASGFCRFLGLGDLVLIQDELEDGEELEWHRRTARTSELSQLLRPKEQLHAFNLDPK